jgi:hypothetical protein
MADYLWTTFIANNDGQNVLVSTTGPGLTGWTADCDIDQASGFAPSAVYFNGRFRIAFVANNEGQNVLVCSSADGANWSNNEDIHQASESAPSLAVYRGRLYMAFMANNEGQNLLVCSSDDGETWSGTVDIGQATGNSPSLAVYDGLLYVAFMANDDGQNVLVRTYDGKNWSNPNVDIGQATGSAPSLAVYDGLLYVAFMANNDGQNVLVCTYDGKNWSNQNVDIGQATRCAPALAAYNGLLYVAFVANNDEKNILVCTYDGRKWSTPSRDISQASGFAPSLTVAPFSYWSTPPDGLGSNSNYLLYGDGKPLIDVSVTIDITKDMVCQSVGPPPANTCPDLGSGTFGFSFQLNCYSQVGYLCAYQQYVVLFLRNGSGGFDVRSGVDNWPASGNNLINDGFPIMGTLPTAVLPKGYRINILLGNSQASPFSVTSAAFQLSDNRGNRVAHAGGAIAGANSPDLAPLTAFELNIVGPINGESAVLSSGVGSITYNSSSPPLRVFKPTASDPQPPKTNVSLITCETANTFYGTVPLGSTSPFNQSFEVSVTDKTIVKRGVHRRATAFVDK